MSKRLTYNQLNELWKLIHCIDGRRFDEAAHIVGRFGGDMPKPKPFAWVQVMNALRHAAELRR